MKLLIFSRNNPEDVRALVDASQAAVDRNPVVDSSDPSRHGKLRDNISGNPPVRILCVGPLGHPKPFQSYVHAHLSADRALHLDSDERLPEVT
jgi:hypothetical protein